MLLFIYRLGIRRTALGLTNGLIRNNVLSANSAKSNSYQSSQARLKIASSWCAASMLRSEWIQVDFGRTVSLTGIATQGDPNAASDRYIDLFYLQRSDDGASFLDVKFIGGTLVGTLLLCNSSCLSYFFPKVFMLIFS